VLHAGLDLSRSRLDFCLVDEDGQRLRRGVASPDRGGLVRFAEDVGVLGGPVTAAIESMNGAWFVHDTLERAGWQVEIADAQKVKGLAPLACKTDRIDAWVLAELSRRDLVPAIWLPDPAVRIERERPRFRLHLVRHRTMFKNRVHSTLIGFGKPCPLSDLFGPGGRQLLAELAIPEPWRAHIDTALVMLQLDEHITACEQELRALGADHPYVTLLQTIPGVGWVLGFTIAAETGDISRFASPKKPCGYTGLCPRVYQSGLRDHRGPLAKNGPKYLRRALIEATIHAAHLSHIGGELRSHKLLAR
jgi:transposase